MDGTQKQTALPRLDTSLLQHLPQFSRLSASEIRAILDDATTRLVGAGDAVFKEGERAENFFLLLDGYVRVVRVSRNGQHVTAFHIPSGQLIGTARALHRNEYPASAIAIPDCLVLAWPQRFWDRFKKDYKGFEEEAYRTIGQRVDELTDHVVTLATQQVEQRVANAILRLVQVAGRKAEGGIEIGFPLTRKDVSEYSATTLHTTSRLLSGWKKRAIIDSQRRRVIVRDLTALKAIAEG